MNFFSDKNRFFKSFIALGIVTVMVLGSFLTVTAAITGGFAATQDKDGEQNAVKDNSIMFNTVVIDNNGTKNAVLFQNGTVAELLETNGIKTGGNQLVIPSLNTVIKDDMIVYIRDAKPVEVTDGGKTKTVVLSLGNVVESLKLSGIDVSKDDILSVKRSAKVEDISKLTIKRVTYKNVVTTTKIDFESKTENSDEIELGETKVKTEGKNGEKQITTRVKYINGKKDSEKVIGEKVTKKPVDEVVLVGTKGVGATGGAGTFTDSNGVTVGYKEVLTGSGTAYTAPAGALTATGVPAYHGGVAIDPNIIPYGSKLYVETTDGSIVYGYCTAVDTGGFCDDGSGIIDVFYDTYDECVNWGRRDVNVYVIE